MTTANKFPEDIEYFNAYKLYLQAFISQFAEPVKGQDKQVNLLPSVAVALGVRDGNASYKSGSTNGLPMSEQTFRVAADVMLGHTVPGKEPGVG